jgi:hypothetical protein
VDHAVCRNIRILSGKDGIDPDCSRDVLIEDALILSKDDAVAIKTRKPPAVTERIEIRNVIAASDASALKIGTETRAPIRNVLFVNCDVFDSDRGIVIYARDGGPIENVTWRNIRMSLIHWPHETGGRPFTFEITDRGGATPVVNCRVANVVTNSIVPSSLFGLPAAPLDDVKFHNIAIHAERPRSDKIEKNPYLFDVGNHVKATINGLSINWCGNESLWAGVASGAGLEIRKAE